MGEIGVGVIGLGAMGINHVRAYQEAGARVVLVADPDASRGALATRRFGAEWTADAKALLADPRVEAVSIAAPTFLHHPLALDAIALGKHVLLEKPVCQTAEQAREVIAAARKAGVTLAVGHVERHNPVVRAARELLSGGAAGEVLSVSSRRVSNGGGRIKDVGVILDLAIHDIDVVRHLVGSDVVAVYAAAGEAAPGEGREDRAHIVLEFRGGVFATLEANWRSPVKVRKLALTCTKGQVELDYVAQSLERSTSQVADTNALNLYTVPRAYESHRIAIQNQEPLVNELSDFLDAARTGRRPLVTGEDGLAALEIAQAAVRSARERRRIELTPAP